MKWFAAIELDNDEGPARIGYNDETGTIWCERLSDGARWDIGVPVKSLEDAKQTASTLWDTYWWKYEEVQDE